MTFGQFLQYLTNVAVLALVPIVFWKSMGLFKRYADARDAEANALKAQITLLEKTQFGKASELLDGVTADYEALIAQKEARITELSKQGEAHAAEVERLKRENRKSHEQVKIVNDARQILREQMSAAAERFRKARQLR